MELQASDLGWTISLRDATVHQVQVDFRLGLLIANQSDWMQVHIESPLRLIEPGKPEIRLTPNDYPTLGPALVLFTRAVTRIDASRSGHLTVRFAGGCVIDVEPDEAYEAWQITTPGIAMICQPGGNVVLFEQT
jgi:hypothetical protein